MLHCNCARNFIVKAPAREYCQTAKSSGIARLLYRVRIQTHTHTQRSTQHIDECLYDCLHIIYTRANKQSHTFIHTYLHSTYIDFSTFVCRQPVLSVAAIVFVVLSSVRVSAFSRCSDSVRLITAEESDSSAKNRKIPFMHVGEIFSIRPSVCTLTSCGKFGKW